MRQRQNALVKHQLEWRNIMTNETGELTNEAQIRQLLDDWAKATREGDNDAVLSNHSSDLLIFDVLAPLQYKGAAAYRKSWDDWRPTDEGEALFEIHELGITAGETVAFAHCLIECGKKPNSDRVRTTFCLQKTDGKWMITHQHVSMPISRKSA
jgi:ketosteroid isomerase-like protein